VNTRSITIHTPNGDSTITYEEYAPGQWRQVSNSVFNVTLGWCIENWKDSRATKILELLHELHQQPNPDQYDSEGKMLSPPPGLPDPFPISGHFDPKGDWNPAEHGGIPREDIRKHPIPTTRPFPKT